MTVCINKLTFKTIIGILPFERKTKQKVIVDISFDYQFNHKNKEFIDYSIVANLVQYTMRKKKFKLIEDAILVLEKKLYKNFDLTELKIKITKPTILRNCLVSVSN